MIDGESRISEAFAKFIGASKDESGRPHVSKRGLLKLAGVAAGVAILPGCAPQTENGSANTPEAPKIPSPMGMKEFDSASGMLPADALKDAFVARQQAAGRAVESRDFYDEWMDTVDDPTVNVMVINYNDEGQVVRISYANHWRGLFDLVDDKNNDTGVSQEINTIFQGKGVVLVADQAYSGPQDCHKAAFENALNNLAPDAIVEGAVKDTRTGNRNVIRLDAAGLTDWMKS